MKEHARNHWLSAGAYTNPGAYGELFRSLPDDIPTLARLVCDQVVHPSILWFPSPHLERYYGPTADYPFGKNKNEDEIFVTAPAMTAELLRLDGRGFVPDRKIGARLAVSCRHVSVLTAAICKAKGIPCRCRAGFIDFLHNGSNCGDHWINQIWSDREGRWINVDADGYYEYERRFGFSQFDLPSEKFFFSPETWLGIRRGTLDGKRFEYQDGRDTRGLKALLIYLFLDFHALMNNELFYAFRPAFAYEGIDGLTEEDLREIDSLAEHMLDPDGNFDGLKAIWEEKNRFRVLKSPFNVIV